MPTTFKQKLNKEQELPKIVKIPKKMQKRLGKGKLLIPHPLEVDKLIRKIKKGKLATNNMLREKLAKTHKADVCCPMATGIFVWIAAGAADEDEKLGKKNITPYWRVLKEKGRLNDRYPGGIKNHAKRLKNEGHIIIKDRVKDLEKSLQRL